MELAFDVQFSVEDVVEVRLPPVVFPPVPAPCSRQWSALLHQHRTQSKRRACDLGRLSRVLTATWDSRWRRA